MGLPFIQIRRRDRDINQSQKAIGMEPMQHLFHLDAALPHVEAVAVRVS